MAVVALTEDLSAKGLLRGQVGTIVEKVTPWTSFLRVAQIHAGW